MALSAVNIHEFVVYFDEDRDGYLSKDEFVKVLELQQQRREKLDELQKLLINTTSTTIAATATATAAAAAAAAAVTTASNATTTQDIPPPALGSKLSDRAELAALKAEYGKKRFHKANMGADDYKAKEQLEEQIARLDAKIAGVHDAGQFRGDEEEEKKGSVTELKATGIPPQPEKRAFSSDKAELAALKAEYGKKLFHKAKMGADDYKAKEQLEEQIARLDAKIAGVPDAFPTNITGTWVHELKKEEADAKASTTPRPEKKRKVSSDKAELAALKEEYSKKRFHQSVMSPQDHTAKEQLEERIAWLEARIEGIPDAPHAFPSNETLHHDVDKKGREAPPSQPAAPPPPPPPLPSVHAPSSPDSPGLRKPSKPPAPPAHLHVEENCPKEEPACFSTFPDLDPTLKLRSLFVPKGKMTMGDYTMDALPTIYQALQSQNAAAKPGQGNKTCLFIEDNLPVKFIRATLDFFPQIVAVSPKCCGNNFPVTSGPNALRIAAKCDTVWHSPYSSKDPRRKKEWQALTAYTRSAECPLLARGADEAEAQGPSSYLRWAFSGPEQGSFLGLLDKRPLVLLIARNISSGQVSNQRDIKNIGAVAAAVVEWARDAGWHAMAPLVLERPDMSHALQAYLFSRATIVVAQHGAALHNLYFTDPANTTVIEVPPVWQDTYKTLTASRGQRYVQPKTTVVAASKQGKARVVDVDVKHLKTLLCGAAKEKHKGSGSACTPAVPVPASSAPK